MLSNAGLSQFSFYLSERNVSLSPREDKKRRKWGQPNASPINRRVDTSSLYPCGESVVIIGKKMTAVADGDKQFRSPDELEQA